MKIHAIPGFPPGVEVERMEPCRLVRSIHIVPRRGLPGATINSGTRCASRSASLRLVVTGRMALGIIDDKICGNFTGSSRLAFISLCVMPVPAVITCNSPSEGAAYLPYAVAVPQGAEENEAKRSPYSRGDAFEPPRPGAIVVVEKARANRNESARIP